MTIGERIRQRRKEIGMSVDELAEKLGKNRATIYRYESDEIENMPITVLEPLARALNVSPAYLMGWEDEPVSKAPTTIAAHLPEGVELTEEDMKQINDFIQFVISKKDKQR